MLVNYLQKRCTNSASPSFLLLLFFAIQASGEICSSSLPEYFDSRLKTCQACESTCTTYCVGPLKEDCLNCQDLNLFRVLDSWECIADCPLDKTFPVELNSVDTQMDFKFCRGFNYYVDPSSESNIELGTLKHPFKALDDSFRELFNFGSPLFQQWPAKTRVKINVKHGSNATLHTDAMPLIIASVDIMIQPYLTPEGKTSRARISIYHMDYYRPPTTNYNPTFAREGTPYPYNFDKLINLGLVPTDIVSEQKFKIMLYNANFTTRHFNWVEESSASISGNSLFVLHGGPYTSLTIDQSTLSLREFLFLSFEGVNVQITNSDINITNLYYLFIYHSLENCDYFLPENSGIANNLLFDNNTVYGTNYFQDIFFLFYLENQGNISITNNLFSGRMVSQDQHILFEQFPIECPFDFYSLYLIENNTDLSLAGEDGKPASYSQMYFTILMDTTGQQDVIIRNNYYQNVKLREAGVYSITNALEANARVIIDNITFENVQNTASPSPIMQITAQTVQISNIWLKNSEITRFINLVTLNASLSNFSISNVVRVDDGLAKQAFDSFFYLTQCQELAVSNISIHETTFDKNTVISLITTANVRVDTVTITDSIANSGHIFYLYTVEGFQAQNVLISNVSKQGGSVISAIQMEILKDSDYEGEETLYLINNLKVTDSKLQVMQLNALTTSEYKNPIKILFRNTSLIGVKLGRKENLVRVNSLIYPALSIEFNDTLLQGSQAELGYFRFQQSGNAVRLKNFEAINNSGNFISVSSELNQTISLSNLSMSGNDAPEALFIIQTNAVLLIEHSRFEDNYSLARGSIILGETSTSVTTIKDSLFKGNYAFQGGVIFVQTYARVSVLDSIFVNNFAYQGGILFQQGEGLATISNCHMEGNLAFYASLIYSINSLSQIEVAGGEITKNGFKYIDLNKAQGMLNLLPSSWGTQILSQQYLQAILSKQVSSIEHLLAMQYDRANYQIQITKAIISLSINLKVHDQVELLQQTSASLAMIRDLHYSDTITSRPLIVTESSLIEFTGITLDKITSSNCAIKCLSDTEGSIYGLEGRDSTLALLYVASSSLTISHWSLHNLTLGADSDVQNLIEIGLSTVQITNLSMVDVTLLLSDSQAMYLGASEARIDLLVASFFYGSLLYVEGGSSFSLLNSIIANNLNPDLASLLAIKDSEAMILNSTLCNLTAQSGPALHAWSSSKLPFRNVISIVNSSFFNNRATLRAGAIFVNDIDVDIKNSTFNNNKALSGNGGAIVLLSKAREVACNFVIERNLFSFNRASENGGAIYYDLYAPQDIGKNVYENNKGQYGNDYASYPYMLRELKIDPITGQLQHQDEMHSLQLVSGREYGDNIMIGVFDQNDQLVTADLESEGQLLSSDLAMQISGTNKVIAKNGVYTFSNLKFVSKPNYKSTIRFVSNALDESSWMELDVAFRECVQGETIKNSMCFTCLKGSYSFNSSNTQCTPCFENGNCLGGNLTLVNQGYWRISNKSTNLYPCPASESCLGGLNSECAIGYTGRMCNTCEKQQIDGDYYGRVGPYKCTKCSPLGVQITILILVLLGLALYVIYLIYQILSNPSQYKPQTVLVRILTNYSQAIMIVYEFNLNWPKQVASALEYFSSFNSAQEYVFSFDCIYKQLDIGGGTPFIYMEVLKFGLMPVFFSLVAALIWYCVHLYQQRAKGVEISLLRNIKVSTFVIVYLIYPSIINFTFSLFNCLSIDDGNSYLKRDFEVQCWNMKHKVMALPIGLTFILGWVLGFPAAIFYLLRKNKHRLSEREFILEYGLFYVGLTEEAYFWEVIVSNLRKVIFVCCSTLLSSYNPIIKAVISVGAITLQMQMSHNFSPYIDPRFDHIEHLGIYSSVFTVFMGLIYVQNDVQKNDVGLLAIFLFIVAINLYFVVSWLKIFATVIFRTQFKRFAQIRYLTFLSSWNVQDYETDLKQELQKLHSQPSIVGRHRYLKHLSHKEATGKKDESWQQGPGLESADIARGDSFASEFSSRSLIKEGQVKGQIEGLEGNRKQPTAKAFRSKKGGKDQSGKARKAKLISNRQKSTANPQQSLYTSTKRDSQNEFRTKGVARNNQSTVSFINNKELQSPFKQKNHVEVNSQSE